MGKSCRRSGQVGDLHSAKTESRAEPAPFRNIDHVVDREDPENAVREVKRLTGGNLRYAVDCIGKTTAELASQTLDQTRSSFLVGLTGLPKELPPNVQGRSVVSL